MHLCFSVRFFSDRYHGADWPPSPARFFQALIAGGKSGAAVREWTTETEKALVWLEGMGAPDILARPAHPGQGYTTYVPNNSLNHQGLSTKTSKQVIPHILRGHSAGELDVMYRWKVPDAAVAQAHLPALDRLAARVRALGWGVDFAAASASLQEAPEHPVGLELLESNSNGEISVRVPNHGLLQHLAECHQVFTTRITQQGINPYTRPHRFATARYRRAKPWTPRRSIAFELQTMTGRPFVARWDQAPIVASWLRHAAGEALKQEELNESWINSYVLGHTAPDNRGDRLSFAPLLSIGHQHSDGGVRRVLIVEPPDLGSDKEALDLLRIKLAGWILTDKEGVERAILAPLSDERKVLPFYTTESAVWQTVTPIILHGYNSLRHRISLEKTNRLLLQAFGSAGFPETIIDSLVFQNAPYWAGSEASISARVPRHLAEWPRLHVSVKFKEPVQGPVLAGIGRHYGIGLFASAR